MSDATVVGIPAELLTKIRNLVEAREKTRAAIEELKRQPGAPLAWVDPLASEAATKDLNFDSLVNKYKEVKALEDRAEEKKKAAEFFLHALDEQLEQYKKDNPEAVIYLLKEKVKQLTAIRDAHEKSKELLNKQIEKLWKEIQDLEGYVGSARKTSA